ncbi:linalool dehydratase/isomerase domain-containing protein [Streptomyces chartreusis]|uniref:linalool dehydratase/isomerase domain-containing protein n=1 Tax=Streptomyces chartreusis TaxID=1969 RepID=UPI003629081E
METSTAAAGLNDRSLGWLRFMWDKATTEDDWSDQGEPHVWWDRYSEPPMCAFPRFDLAEMAYVLPMMLEATPAWREGYTRILDELARRYMTFWGAVDWNTLIGPDPNVDQYPPEWLAMAPESLRGRYALPGWTGNGVEPWGLQPDPIGSDGNLFYRGWLNLLLGIRRYVSDEPREDIPFEVSGYQNRTFVWTHRRMARFISDQLAARPQGTHCENTKIWLFCLSAAGLGLQLHDALLGTTVNEPFLRWVSFAQKHYMGRDRKGRLDWVAFYYDPIEESLMTFPGRLGAYGALCLLHYLYPQDEQLGIDLYECAVRQLGWNNPDVPVIQWADDPQMLSTAMWMAREIGDDTTWNRLREICESRLQPRFFGEDDSRFAYWCGFPDPWPRGQINATLMMIECAEPGAWSRVFNKPMTGLSGEPTVHGVDYPLFGIRRTHHDRLRGALEIDTFAATPSHRGRPTSFTVGNLPTSEAVRVRVDGRPYESWRRTAVGSVEIDLPVDTHRVDVAYAPPHHLARSGSDRKARP